MLFIGHQLQSKRINRNWKQKYVAEQTGISQTVLSRMENNQQGVTEDDIQKFAKIFNTTEEDLKTLSIPAVHLSHNSIKGNGYVHQQNSTNNELFQQSLTQLQNAYQQIISIMQELKTDKEFLREENRQLLQRDEKWMKMIMEMQTQLVNFLSKGN